MDGTIEIIYVDVNHRPAEERNVKSWWSSKLTPVNHRRQRDAQGDTIPLTAQQQFMLDNSRFEACLALLKLHCLDTSPKYAALISSGTLRYLTQTSTTIRNTGNTKAHSLIDVADYRSLLTRARGDSSICPAESIDYLTEMVNFVEITQNASSV